MIIINELRKEYRIGGNIVNALDNVNLYIQTGEYVAITGTSGSGKTTLMNIMGCLDTASGGEYFLDGKNVSSLAHSSLAYIRNVKIGFIFQNFNLLPTLTAKENIELPLVYRRTPKRERERLANEALEMVGLVKRGGHKPSQLSGGQQQRVAIARAVAARPAIILADEPCGNLDSKSGSDVMNILSDLNSLGKTIILITHDNLAAQTAKRTIRIHDGRIVEDNC